MRAAPGAMERVQIDEKTLEPKYKVIGVEGWNTDHADSNGQVKGICGSAIIDAVAEIFRVGIITFGANLSAGLKLTRICDGRKRHGIRDRLGG